MIETLLSRHLYDMLCAVLACNADIVLVVFTSPDWPLYWVKYLVRNIHGVPVLLMFWRLGLKNQDRANAGAVHLIAI